MHVSLITLGRAGPDADCADGVAADGVETVVLSGKSSVSFEQCRGLLPTLLGIVNGAATKTRRKKQQV